LSAVFFSSAPCFDIFSSLSLRSLSLYARSSSRRTVSSTAEKSRGSFTPAEGVSTRTSVCSDSLAPIGMTGCEMVWPSSVRRRSSNVRVLMIER
jgi:hypothetical protein